ncbi:hypothetical protein IMY05_017G0056200 [Salix suchowensis]|nr:hypothetical protein IMY05_017G0056200 [Salix suchowensis]
MKELPAVQDLTRDTSLASLIVNSRAIGVCKVISIPRRDETISPIGAVSAPCSMDLQVISIPRRDETISPVGAVSAPCTMDLQECRFSLQTSRASLNVKSRAIGVCKGL